MAWSNPSRREILSTVSLFFEREPVYPFLGFVTSGNKPWGIFSLPLPISSGRTFTQLGRCCWQLLLLRRGPGINLKIISAIWQMQTTLSHFQNVNAAAAIISTLSTPYFRPANRYLPALCDDMSLAFLLALLCFQQRMSWGKLLTALSSCDNRSKVFHVKYLNLIWN